MKLLIGLLVCGFLVGVVTVAANGWHLDTGSGEHTGYITAVEKSGIIWKTGRAYIKTDVSSSQEDAYCVVDSAVYSRLEELARNQSKVTVRYQEWLIQGFTVCNSEQAVITEIK